MEHGQKVHCLAGNIDNGRGVGAVGYVTGFARHSSYHAREVYVSNTTGAPTEKWCGWFWEKDVQAMEG